MAGEVVNRDLDTLALLEFAQGGDQQLEVKGARMVKVVVVAGGQTLLLGAENLHTVSRARSRFRSYSNTADAARLANMNNL